MSDAVVDTSFIALANGCIAADQPGTIFGRRLAAIKRIVDEKDRLRYNPKLLKEYEPHIRECRNDIIDQFVALLDNKRTIKLTSSTLRRTDNAKADECRWPTHDKHVLAAAISGDDPIIHVTEHALGACEKAVRKKFGFRINYIPSN